MRIYLAGPCTGIAEFNYPRFHIEAERLRDLGYEVKSPAELPSQEHQDNPWQHYMRHALRQMLTCDAVALLPGWSDSRGAFMEYTIASRVGIPCWTAESFVESRINKTMWYTTEQARRDAQRQAEEKKRLGIPEQCSSFCHPDEPCSITGDGRCHAEIEKERQA